MVKVDIDPAQPGELAGVAFVDERLTWNLIIGTAMILVGPWIAEHNSDEREVASETLKLSENGFQDASSAAV